MKMDDGLHFLHLGVVWVARIHDTHGWQGFFVMAISIQGRIELYSDFTYDEFTSS
jgi:hypothetical protein